MTNQTPAAPAGLKPRGRGRGLWREVTQHLELDVHELALLTEAARTADLLDDLEALKVKKGVLAQDEKIAPWVVELRQQRLTLARVLAALRLPDDIRESVEQRPQHRFGARGTYPVRLKSVKGA